MKKLLQFVLWLIVAALLTSCGSSKKIKSSSFTKLDSTGITIAKEVSVKKENTSANNIVENSTENSFEFSFEEAKERADDLCKDKSTKKYEVEATAKKYTVKINGHTIESSRPIKGIKYQGKENTKITEAIVNNTTDSSTNDTNISTVKTQEINTTEKKKEYSGFPLSSWFLLLLSMLVLVAIIFRKEIKKYIDHV
jgi:hypothetical protein